MKYLLVILVFIIFATEVYIAQEEQDAPEICRLSCVMRAMLRYWKRHETPPPWYEPMDSS